MDLGITTRQSGSTTVVSVTGELDVHTATDLELALGEMISNGQHYVVVDLRGLDFLDSGVNISHQSVFTGGVDHFLFHFSVIWAPEKLKSTSY